jgi:hypothetical protein
MMNQTRITLKVVENSLIFNIMSSRTLKYLYETRELYYELNQDITDISNISIVFNEN